MSNKLFLVCPFSCLENFIRRKYSDDVFFVTAMGTIFQFKGTKYLETLKDFVSREKIAEIFLVIDTSCRFINSALKNDPGHGFYSEMVIKNIFRANELALRNHKSQKTQQIKLAELIIDHQINEIKKLSCFEHESIQRRITFKGLITTKGTNQIIKERLI